MAAIRSLAGAVRNSSLHRQLEACTARASCDLAFESRDGRLYANGRLFDIKGINWWSCYTPALRVVSATDRGVC